MEFGIFPLAQQRSYNQSATQVVQNTVQQTVAAEQAGFNAAWYAEHHFNNYSLLPSPLVMIAHCASLTKTIRLGSAVCVLPLYNPSRLLSEVGLVDILSNGRLELGIGSGYQEFEFERFNVELKESQDVFREFYEILQLGLREKVFSYEGKHFKVLPSAISTRPVQSPTPPLWVTTSNPEFIRRAMREGHNLFVTAYQGGNDAVRALRAKLDDYASKENRSISDTKVGIVRCAFASDDKTEIRQYLENAQFQRRVSEGLRHRQGQSGDGYMVPELPSPTDVPLDVLESNLPIGSTNRVIDKLLEEIEILRPNHIMIQTQLGDLDQTMMLRQIALWGEKIIPAVQKALAGQKAH